MLVLIADDDRTSRTVLAAVLRKIGHDVVEAEDGLGALSLLLSADGPGLAVLDWMMPGLDGLEVVRRVRAADLSFPPYLVMLTSRGDKADVIAGLDGGANDYLAKPFDTGELRARIEVGSRMVAMQRALIESREALAYEASHDGLTGILNRRASLDRLERLVAARSPLALAICDIDHFKKVNDVYGHPTGDDVLRGLAVLLKEACGPDGFAGRLGGEEFLVLFPAGGGEAPSLCEALRVRIAESPFKTRSGPVSVTVSFGVALAREGGAESLLGVADRALYQAKREGRNRVVTVSTDVGGP